MPSKEGIEKARRHLGKRLREQRSSSGLSQAEAAQVAGASQATYSRFEAGSASIGYKPLRALAGHYGVKMMSLMPSEQYPSAPSEPVERQRWVDGRNHGIASADHDLTLGARK